jgi:hypothetical protein
VATALIAIGLPIAQHGANPGFTTLLVGRDCEPNDYGDYISESFMTTNYKKFREGVSRVLTKP